MRYTIKRGLSLIIAIVTAALEIVVWPPQVRFFLVKGTREMNRIINVKLNIASWIFAAVIAFLGCAGVICTDLTRAGQISMHASILHGAAASKVGFCIPVMIALIPLRKAEDGQVGSVVLRCLATCPLLPAAIWQGSGPRAGFEIPGSWFNRTIGRITEFRVGFQVGRTCGYQCINGDPEHIALVIYTT
jgi:hypothetical protein